LFSSPLSLFSSVCICLSVLFFMFVIAIAGGCETIPLVLQAHPNSDHVASAGCDVITFMSEVLSNGFAARFGHGGACEAVVR
jgi:hypothetical protein